MPRLREYLDQEERSPYGRWLDSLPAQAAAKVSTAMARLEGGNTSSLKGVGQGVHEVRIDFGPGYRVYVGQDGAELVILLGGSTKARQRAAIEAAQTCWVDYKARKRKGTP
jgi:putative addiction module killer protein